MRRRQRSGNPGLQQLTQTQTQQLQLQQQNSQSQTQCTEDIEAQDIISLAFDFHFLRYLIARTTSICSDCDWTHAPNCFPHPIYSFYFTMAAGNCALIAFRDGCLRVAFSNLIFILSIFTSLSRRSCPMPSARRYHVYFMYCIYTTQPPHLESSGPTFYYKGEYKRSGKQITVDN